jgi:hypothetical protein
MYPLLSLPNMELYAGISVCRKVERKWKDLLEITNRLLPNARGYNWATLFLGQINIGTWPSRLRSLRNGANKICYWIVWDSNLRKAALAMPSKNWKLHIRLLVREGTPHQQTRNCLKIIKERRRNIGRGSHMGAWHHDRLAYWPTVVM